MKFPIELTTKRIICSELKVKHYKELLKSIYGEEPSFEAFIVAFKEILQDLTNLTEDEINKLNVLDLFLIILELRIYSLGSKCKITIQLKDEKKLNVELSLEGIRDDLKNNIPISLVVEQGDLQVFLSLPAFTRFDENHEEEYLYFISGFKKNPQSEIVEIDNNNMSKQLFDALLPKTGLEIIKQYNNFVHQITDLDLLERYAVEQKLNFVPNPTNLLWFTKLFFNERLDSFYDNIFFLSCKANMSPAYVEECGPGEYIYFVKKLEEMLSSQQESGDDTQNEYGSTDFNGPDPFMDDGFQNL